MKAKRHRGHSSPASSAICFRTLNQLGGNLPREIALLIAVSPTPRRVDMADLVSVLENVSMVMSHTNPHFVNIRKSTFGGLPFGPQFVKPIGMAEDAQFVKIGRRIEAVRQSFTDLSQREFAMRYGFNPTQWSNRAPRSLLDCPSRLGPEPSLFSPIIHHLCFFACAIHNL